MSFLSPQARRGARKATQTNAGTPSGKAAADKLDTISDADLPKGTPFDTLPFNQKVAKIFEAIAQYMSQMGEDAFRVGAYERAANIVRATGADLSIWSEKDLQTLPSIGKSTASKIREIADTGTCKKYAELRASSPPETISELEKLPGVGPVGALRLWKEHKIDSLATLGKSIEEGIITDPKLVQGFEFVNKELERIPLGLVLPFIREFMEALLAKHGAVISKISPAGSVRRGRETVRDVDILVCTEPQHVAEIQATIVKEFSQHGAEAQGDKKCRLLYIQDILKVQIDVLFTPQENWGAKLLYFTGSKEFNVATRRKAKALGLTLNEYGLWKGKECIASRTEESILNALGIDYVPPWLREHNVKNFINIEAGKSPVNIAIPKQLPTISRDVKSQAPLYAILGGTIHNHCIFATPDGKQWDDGRIKLMDLVYESKRRGMRYIGISSHSKSLPIARGLTAEALRAQMLHIRENTWELPIYCGSEMEVKVDGSLDWHNDTLNELDYAIAALHMQPGKNTTERIIAAMQHPKVCAIAHPTGRIFAERPAAEADWDKIFEVAIETNTALEFNVQPSRADLPEDLLARAIKAGVKILLSIDTHRLIDFDNMPFGVTMFNRAQGTEDHLFNFEEWLT